MFIIFPTFAKYLVASSIQLFRVPSCGSERQCFTIYDKIISAEVQNTTDIQSAQLYIARDQLVSYS